MKSSNIFNKRKKGNSELIPMESVKKVFRNGYYLESFKNKQTNKIANHILNKKNIKLIKWM